MVSALPRQLRDTRVAVAGLALVVPRLTVATRPA